MFLKDKNLCAIDNSDTPFNFTGFGLRELNYKFVDEKMYERGQKWGIELDECHGLCMKIETCTFYQYMQITFPERLAVKECKYVMN